jgi:hypothetical protein
LVSTRNSDLPRYPRFDTQLVNQPAARPIVTAENSFHKAIPNPRPPRVIKNALGLIKGEEIRNTITGAVGAPAASMAATAGRTPMAQRGLTSPSSSAPVIAHAPARCKNWATFVSSFRVDITDAMIMAKSKNHHNSAKICPAVSIIAHASKNMFESPQVHHSFLGPHLFRPLFSIEKFFHLSCKP